MAEVESAHVHRDNLEKTLVWVWLAMLVVFGAQWIWIATVMNAPWTMKAVSGAFLVTEAMAAAYLLRGGSHPRVASAQLAAAVVTAAGLLIVASTEVFGEAKAVGDGLLVLLAPALSAYVAFGRVWRLAIPCLVVIAVASPLGYLSWLGASAGGVDPGYVSYEQALVNVANLVVIWGITRLLRAGARQADEVSEESARLAARKAAEEVVVQADQRAVELVHDDVLHALLALSQPPLGRIALQANRLVDSAIDGLSKDILPLRAKGDDDEDLVSAVLAELADWRGSATLQSDIDVTRQVIMPAEVVDAFVRALRQSLVNIEQHAAAAAVKVALRSGDHAQLVVADDGVGFDVRQPRPGHYGLTGSIVGRMRMVGGDAHIESRLGYGTTISLTWRMDRRRLTSVRQPTERWSWVERIGVTPSWVWLTYFLPHVVVTASFAAIHLPESRNPLAAVSILVGQVSISLFAAWTAPKLFLSGRASSILIVVNALLLLGGIEVITPGTQNGYAYWSVGASGWAISLIALLRPFREAMVAAALVVLTIWFALQSSIGGTIGALAVVSFNVLAGVATRVAFSRLTPISEEYLALLAEARAADEKTQRIREVEQRRTAAVRQRVLPFLVKARAFPPGGDHEALHHESASLAQWTRSHLGLPGLFDEEFSRLWEQAERQGVKLTVLGQDPTGAAVSLGRRLAKAALAEATVREVTLSFSLSQPEQTDVMLVMVCAEPIGPGLRSSLSELDTPLTIETAGTLLSAYWSPTSVAEQESVP